MDIANRSHMLVIDTALERWAKSKFSSMSICSPFTIPSGIVTTVPAVIARIARDVPQIGLLTTKTLSVSARPGFREPVLYEYHPGCFVNAVGLANPGAEQFRDAMLPHLPLHGNKPLVVSIMGQDPEEFLSAALILDSIADAFELNLSCPHVKGAGQSVGSDVTMVRSLIELLKARVNKPIIAKLSPNLSDVVGMARVCEASGADALALVNTVGPGVATDCDGNPVLSNVVGGLSGAGILPVGLKVVREVAAEVGLPIIASGGIGSATDVRAYFAAGATLFAVGSALAGMTTPEIVDFFARMETDLMECNVQSRGAAEFATCLSGRPNTHSPQSSVVRKSPLTGSRTEYAKTSVVEKVELGGDVFALRLNQRKECDPGRFFFLRLPGVGEKPFSPAGVDPTLLFLVREVGPFTSALRKLKPGDTIYVRGPYGKGFPEPVAGTRVVLMGGGTGIAPLIMVAERWPEVVARTFFGFSRELAFGRLLDRVPHPKVVFDPPGRVGEVIRVLEHDIAEHPDLYGSSLCFLCGPAKMMESAAHALETVVPRGRIYIGREDIMRCGIGICGSCGTDAGFRSCVDGPVIVR